MAGDPPKEHTITAVTGDNKIVVEGFNGVLEVLPKGQSFSEGQTVKGWLNPEGKYGPYIKIAEERGNGAQTRSAGSSQPARDDATGRSIERQVAAKIAGELIGHEGYSQMGDAFAAEFRKVTNAVHAAISDSDADVPW